MTAQWAWASHQPVIKSIFDLYAPDFVFESGIGLYSTAILSKAKEYIGVENDKQWINKVKEHFAADIIHHKLDINSSEKWYNLTDKQRYDIISFYSDFWSRIDSSKAKTKLLFVDGYLCTRMLVINTLWQHFDVIIYHDSRYRRLYGYDKLKVQGFASYEAITTPNSANTGILLQNDVGFDVFNAKMQEKVADFDSEWQIKSNIRLIK